MKKYIVSALVASIFLIGAPFVVSQTSAADLSVRDLINLLIAIGVIGPEKIQAVNIFLANIGSAPIVAPSTPVCSTLTQDLATDSNGTEVIILQNFLAKNGYVSGNASGYFGTMTRQAVISFQTNNNISPVNGIVGYATRNLINNMNCGIVTPITSSVNLKSVPNGNSNGFDYIVTSNQPFEKVTFTASCDVSQVAVNAKGGMDCNYENIIGLRAPTTQYSYPISFTSKDNSSHTVGMMVKAIMNGNVIGTDKDAVTIYPITSSSIQDSVSITGSPTLELSYDSAQRESQLTATFNITVDAGSNNMYIYRNANPPTFRNQTDNSHNFTGAAVVSPLGSSTNSLNDQFGQMYYVVPAGTEASFSVISQVNPKIMFAGSYVADFNSVIVSDVDPRTDPYKFAAVFLKGGTNYKTIIGETSPYITSVTNSVQVGTMITINGQRLNGSSVFIDDASLANVMIVGAIDGSYLSFTLPNLTAGYHNLYVKNDSTGQSNAVQFNVTGISQPSIVITDSSGNQGITVNVGDTFTLSGVPKNLAGLQYWYDFGYPYGNYYNRAYVFDSMFDGSCSNNEASTNGVWTITCKAKTSGVGNIHIEIFKDGQVYKSNIVQVTVKSTTQPSITVTSPNGGESYQTGSVKRISWSSVNVTRPITIYLADVVVADSGNGQLQNVAIDLPSNSTYYDWTIPSNIVPGRYKIIINSYVLGQYTFSDKSDNYFTITAPSTQPSITVTSPNGGETLTEGSQYNIKWNTSGLSSSQNLDITLNPNVGSGSTGKTIVSGVPNTGSYSWTVKSLQPFFAEEANTWITPNGQYNIYVVCPISSAVCNYNHNFGQSGVFTIQTPTSNLTAASIDLTGTQSTYTPGQLIKYSVKGIASNGQTGDPSRNFNVQANIQTGNATVQVNGIYQSVNANYNSNTGLWDVTMTAPSDTSKIYTVDSAFYCSRPGVAGGCADNQLNKSFTFTITAPSTQPSITVTSPNGGQTFTQGQSVPISFSTNLTSQQAPTGFNIILYGGTPTNIGSYNYIQTIVNRWTGGSPYNWAVPSSLPLQNYTLYIVPDQLASGISNAGLFDFSDNYFSIVAPTPVNGACGSTNSTSVTSAPTTNLCSTGIVSAVSGTGPWTWTCAGSNGGTTASCSASVAVSPIVSLSSVQINGSNLAVTYSKNFDTCAHLLNTNTQILHIQNWFCQSGTNVVTTAPLSDFQISSGQQVKLCHGNNYNICSDYVTVTVAPTAVIYSGQNYAAAAVSMDAILRLIQALR